MDDREQRARALREAPSYRIAFEDIDFLMREDLRPVRLQLELLKPEMLLRQHHINSTIVVFGSARVPSPEDADAHIRRAEAAVQADPDSSTARAGLLRAQRQRERVKYYEEARRFAALVSSQAKTDGGRECVIITGGGPGIMEAANRGAYEIGAKSIGLNIDIPHEQEPNPYISPELCFRFHYFALRKMHFMLRARALVAFPGGFGTLDELFDALTLIQTKVIEPIPILLVGREYWQRVLALDVLVEEGTIAPEDRDLVEFVQTAEEAWHAILRAHPELGR
ncbi:MAG: LOG family protein [Gemmatimonadales bacterium]|jgi:uncharacterized protein (TIGR00730 family)